MRNNSQRVFHLLKLDLYGKYTAQNEEVPKNYKEVGDKLVERQDKEMKVREKINKAFNINRKETLMEQNKKEETEYH